MRRRIDQHGTIIDDRVAIFRHAIFARHLVISDAGRRQIFADAKAAVSGASSVHFSGQIDDNGDKISLDVSAAKGRGGGHVTVKGATLDIVYDRAAVVTGTLSKAETGDAVAGAS